MRLENDGKGRKNLRRPDKETGGQMRLENTGGGRRRMEEAREGQRRRRGMDETE